MKLLFHKAVLCVTLAAAFNPAVAAQITLSGRILDPTQLAVPGATITVINRLVSLERSARSDASGLYTLVNLPPGRYDVTIVAPGFQTQEHRDLMLGTRGQQQLDFTLDIRTMVQTLPVVGQADRLQTSDASVGNTLERHLIANLPLNGRSILNLITLAPGVTLSNAQNSNGQFVVNGLRASTNSFSIDGVNAVGTIVGYQSAGGNNAGYNAAGGTSGMVAVDALEEVQVVTSSFAPEFGRNPGAHIILITRSGSNQFHGTAFEYLRNDKLDAADWFVNQAAQTKPRLRSNDFGGVFGGPVVRNRTFFFLSYEGQRIAEPKFTITSVPSVAARNAAPAIAQPFLNAFPVPNGPDLGEQRAQFSAGYSNRLTTDSALLKLDQVITSRLRSFISFTWAPSSKTSRSNNGTASLADSSVQNLRARSLTAGLTYVPAPRLAGDLRINIGDSRNQSRFTMDEFAGAVVPANYFLLPGTTPANYYSFVSLGDGGGNLFGGDIGTFLQRQVNIIDSNTVVQRGHQVKFGVDYRLLLPVVQSAGEQYFQFNGFKGLIGNQLEAFHNTSPAQARIQMTSLSAYAQDTWQVASELSLTYGLRWDWNTVPRSRDPNNGNLVQLLGDYARSDVIVGAPGAPLWQQRRGAFAPRIGGAWRWRNAPGRETVVRAGGGLFYDTGIAEAASQPWISGYPAGQATVLLNSNLPVSPSLAMLPPVNLKEPPPGNRFFPFAPRLRPPRVWQWNATLQQALGVAQVLCISYVGSSGGRLLYSVAYPMVTANTYPVVYTDDSGYSSYHALQLHYERRLSRGVAANLSYTWGHSIDTNSSDTSTYVPAVFQPPSSNRGDSDFDIRHALHGGFSWSLPSQMLAGWALDGIVTAQSGLPVNVTIRRDIGFGTYEFRPDLVAGLSPWIPDSNVAAGRRINRAALVVPSSNVQGNLARNALRGFDLVQIDLAARRSFRIADKVNLTFRADLFNALNHPNFANPISAIGSGLFGFSTASVADSQFGGGAFGLNSIFNIGGPRAVQLSLKLQF